MPHPDPTTSPVAVAVVIPLFNKAAHVPRAIASVLGQTCPPAQIIVVDDGSTDDGPEIVRGIADPRIQLVMQSNQGVSAARNRGIALATSDLIAFLDADDEWLPDHLQTIVRLRQAFPQCDVLGTSYLVRVDASTAGRQPIFRGLPPEPWEGMLADYFAIAAKSDPPLNSSVVAAMRTALASIGGFPVGIGQGEDLLTWARLALRYRIAYCTKPSAVFWHPAFDSNVPTRRPAEVDRVATELATLLEQADAPQRPSLRKYVGLWHKMRGTMYLRLGDRAAARAELRRAWQFAGFSWRLLVYRLVALLPTPLTGLFHHAIGLARRVYRLINARHASSANGSCQRQPGQANTGSMTTPPRRS